MHRNVCYKRDGPAFWLHLCQLQAASLGFPFPVYLGQSHCCHSVLQGQGRAELGSRDFGGDKQSEEGGGLAAPLFVRAHHRRHTDR